MRFVPGLLLIYFSPNYSEQYQSPYNGIGCYSFDDIPDKIDQSHDHFHVVTSFPWCPVCDTGCQGEAPNGFQFLVYLLFGIATHFIKR